MKKLIIPFVCFALFACNKPDEKNSSNANRYTVLWAETAQTTLPLERDTVWDKADWEKTYQTKPDVIFNSIVNAVKSQKLQAYSMYPDGPLSVKEFNSLLVSWDSTHTVEDPNNKGTIIFAPLQTSTRPEDIIQLRFDEKMEFDTVSCMLHKKVSVVHFLKYKFTETGERMERMGLMHFFDVKLNDGSPAVAIEKK